jgi:hypothetical protein
MIRKWIAVLGMAAMLGACSHAPVTQQTAQVAEAQHPWNGGVWNSVLGYHGPDNLMVVSP